MKRRPGFIFTSIGRCLRVDGCYADIIITWLPLIVCYSFETSHNRDNLLRLLPSSTWILLPVPTSCILRLDTLYLLRSPPEWRCVSWQARSSSPLLPARRRACRHWRGVAAEEEGGYLATSWTGGGRAENSNALQKKKLRWSGSRRWKGELNGIGFIY